MLKKLSALPVILLLAVPGFAQKKEYALKNGPSRSTSFTKVQVLKLQNGLKSKNPEQIRKDKEAAGIKISAGKTNASKSGVSKGSQTGFVLKSGTGAKGTAYTVRQTNMGGRK